LYCSRLFRRVHCKNKPLHRPSLVETMIKMRMSRFLRLLALPCVLLARSIDARAILGVDLGSLYMKVALVQSGSPLEIVTNLHSKRKTEQMILFDQNQRFYGADAASLLARKSHQTPEAMSVLLGRDEKHPIVQVCS
jgi:hypoxia up-regulated 1